MNGNGEPLASADGGMAAPRYGRRADDREEVRIRNTAFAEFQARRGEASTAEAYFASLDVYRRELCYIAVKRGTTGR